MSPVDKCRRCFNGMATAADWMSGASFVALAGGIYFGGHGYLALVVGWTGGYVLVSSLMAPYLRKFGCYTVPDFIGTRYGGNMARLCAVVVLAVASFTYVTAQINATGTIAARALQIPFEIGVWFGLLGILLCSMLGGMRAVTWTQVAQYIVLIIAYLVPVFWMSNAQDFGVIPQFAYGDAVVRIGELEQVLGVGTPATESVAGLRVLTTLHNAPQGDAAIQLEIRHAGALYDGGNGVAAAYFDAVFHDAVGQSGATIGGVVVVFHLPFVFHRTGTGDFHEVCNCWIRPSRPASSARQSAMCRPWTGSRSGAMSTCWRSPTATATVSCRSMNSSCDRISWCWRRRRLPGCRMSSPAWSLPAEWRRRCRPPTACCSPSPTRFRMTSTTKSSTPKPTRRHRLIVARVLLVGIGAAGALVASLKLTGILGAVIWAFDFACSGLFFPIVLGIWWKRANRAGAIAGMVCGFVAGTLYLYWVAPQFLGNEVWFGIDHLRFGMIGMPVSLVAMVVVTLMTPEPDAETQAMVDEIRVPKGKTVLESTH